MAIFGAALKIQISVVVVPHTHKMHRSHKTVRLLIALLFHPTAAATRPENLDFVGVLLCNKDEPRNAEFCIYDSSEKFAQSKESHNTAKCYRK